MQRPENQPIFTRMWRSLTGRSLARPSSYYQTPAARHALPEHKLKALRKRRAKNKVARATRQNQRKAAHK